MKAFAGNRGRKWSFIVFLLILTGCFFLSDNSLAITSQDEKTNSSETGALIIKGKDLYDQGRKMFYNAESEVSDAKAALIAGQEVFRQLEEGFPRYYWQAIVQFELGRITETTGDKVAAGKYFDETIMLSKKALLLDGNSSDANRLLGSSYAKLINVRVPMSVVRHMAKIPKLLNLAIHLDENNYAAYTSLGIYYYNLPKLFGGSLDKAVSYMQKARDSKDEFERFYTYAWLGIVYRQQEKMVEAVASLNGALAIYPNSPWVKGLLREVEGDQR